MMEVSFRAVVGQNVSKSLPHHDLAPKPNGEQRGRVVKFDGDRARLPRPFTFSFNCRSQLLSNRCSAPLPIVATPSCLSYLPGSSK